MFASTHYIKAYATVGPIPQTTERIKKLLIDLSAAPVTFTTDHKYELIQSS